MTNETVDWQQVKPIREGSGYDGLSVSKNMLNLSTTTGKRIKDLGWGFVTVHYKKQQKGVEFILLEKTTSNAPHAFKLHWKPNNPYSGSISAVIKTRPGRFQTQAHDPMSGGIVFSRQNENLFY